MIDGVIFDMDGLMFDTERVWATLWEPALATLGLSYKEGLDVAARGTAGDTMRAVLRRFYGENCDTDAIIEALHAQAEKAFQAPPPKKPGLDEILTWLDAQHIPMAVASSSRMASIRHHLDGWGLTHYFKVIVSGEQFSASKPDPEIFLLAAEKLWYGHGLEKTRLLKHLYMFPLLAVSFVLFNAADLPAAGQQISIQSLLFSRFLLFGTRKAVRQCSRAIRTILACSSGSAWSLPAIR